MVNWVQVKIRLLCLFMFCAVVTPSYNHNNNFPNFRGLSSCVNIFYFIAYRYHHLNFNTLNSWCEGVGYEAPPHSSSTTWTKKTWENIKPSLSPGDHWADHRAARLRSVPVVEPDDDGRHVVTAIFSVPAAFQNIKIFSPKFVTSWSCRVRSWKFLIKYFI